MFRKLKCLSLNCDVNSWLSRLLSVRVQRVVHKSRQSDFADLQSGTGLACGTTALFDIY